MNTCCMVAHANGFWVSGDFVPREMSLINIDTGELYTFLFKIDVEHPWQLLSSKDQYTNWVISRMYELPYRRTFAERNCNALLPSEAIHVFNHFYKKWSSGGGGSRYPGVAVKGSVLIRQFCETLGITVVVELADHGCPNLKSFTAMRVDKASCVLHQASMSGAVAIYNLRKRSEEMMLRLYDQASAEDTEERTGGSYIKKRRRRASRRAPAPSLPSIPEQPETSVPLPLPAVPLPLPLTVPEQPAVPLPMPTVPEQPAKTTVPEQPAKTTVPEQPGPVKQEPGPPPLPFPGVIPIPRKVVYIAPPGAAAAANPPSISLAPPQTPQHPEMVKFVIPPGKSLTMTFSAGKVLVTF